MAYEWQTVDIVPDDDREVCVWIKQEKEWATGYYFHEQWYIVEYGICNTITHWKDIKPPKD